MNTFLNYDDFFVKVQGIVGEMQSRYSDMIGLVAPRTHLMSGQGKPLQMVLDVNEYMALHDIWLAKEVKSECVVWFLNALLCCVVTVWD